MTERTVFVIGAGASSEAGLPIGNQLKLEIAGLLGFKLDHFGRICSGDDLIRETLEHEVKVDDGHIQAAQKIKAAMILAESIDTFIDHHQANEKIALCGKLAIVRAILKAEEGSHELRLMKSGADSTIDFKRLSETWYIPFFRLITKNCRTRQELKKRFESFCLVIFNYDRCVEHFMYYALHEYFDVNKTEAAELVQSINIFHPYGSVGHLPWDNPKGAIEFGETPSRKQLLNLTNQIKTFTERTNPESSISENIRWQMAWADKLVFLGFAFENLNLELIAPTSHHSSFQGTPRLELKCFGTSYRISDGDQAVIEQQIIGMYYDRPVNVDTLPLECFPFFAEFKKRLTAPV